MGAIAAVLVALFGTSVDDAALDPSLRSRQIAVGGIYLVTIIIWAGSVLRRRRRK
jgi:hypothetical protein